MDAIEPIEAEPILTPEPTATETPTATLPATPTETAGPTPTVTPIVALVVVTNTPIPTQRPIEYPSPTPTADSVLFAAQVLDNFVAAAGWIWFLGGSLVFFVVAGIIAGLSFRRQERRRFDLEEADETERHDFWAEEKESSGPGGRRGAASAQADEDDDWPESLP